jgi:Domain of unknown function (DUF4440)
LPDLVVRNRQEFLDLIAEPRPFNDLTLLYVNVRLLGDVALLHGRVSYTTIEDGAKRESLYTATDQRRGGQWPAWPQKWWPKASSRTRGERAYRWVLALLRGCFIR